ncbi:hypothetical protein TNCV_688921 [Trichonephila clavipes]|nr:hypothetical protein TNCV_688921 [Trichonephila clavipes]
MSFSSFHLQQDSNVQQSSASMENILTNTHCRAAAVGCRCHRSTHKTVPYSRVVTRQKKTDETPSAELRFAAGCPFLSFHMHQDATPQQSSASTKKGDEHLSPHERGRMALSSFCVHQDATGQQGSASTEKGYRNTHRRASAGGMSFLSFRAPRNRIVVLPRRKKRDEHPPPRGCGRILNVIVPPSTRRERTAE